ncbi:uncharacterized protein EV420DRAFT_893043 [Desarmillaria tabescens]|uniref:Thioredoxin domain-containing protein n=1 Tax=Armillaria tabescens TaxID=1929756 RepID=A0AA39JPH7_ARMTA|nr:uncharacterized protein EV420DRAFT_893043 [Desarmillaria tabescens]KAK0446542.1 hypothetical protein EV420DRAFT_893043 [Desarmillaria tabescens]
MACVTHIDGAQELRKLISAQQRTVVFFHQPWCSHCKKMGPIFDATASLDEYKEVKFYEFDLDEQEDVMEEMDIKTFPRILVFRQGEKIAATGPRELEAFKTWLSSAMTRQEIVNTPIDEGTTCTGRYEDRRRNLATLLGGSKPFLDTESGCVFQPTPESNGLQIGRANQGTSYFLITMWNSENEDPNKIFFGLHFMPDPIHKARFESARFWVTFGRDDGDEEHLPLNVLELAPTSAADTITASPDSDVMGSTEFDNSSIWSGEEAIRRGTPTDIRGQGLHSPTAVWSFVEGTSRGLDASYTLSVVLPTTTRVWMKFWAKAVLIRGDTIPLDLRHKMTLKTGTMEEPYQRILDLSVAMERAEPKS